MGNIRYFKLKNSGAFVVKMQVEWTASDGQGNESHGVYKPDGYHDICAAAERTIDLKSTKIPDGATVHLIADVAGGKNKTSEDYIYDSKCGDMATYKIKGTTLINSLVKV